MLSLITYYFTNKKLKKIMTELEVLKATVAEVNAKTDTLLAGLTGIQTVIDAEQQVIAEAIDGLTAQIAALPNVADVTELTSELQAISDKLTGASNSLAAASADVASTIADAPAAEELPNEPVVE
jgi:uncharacterized phage infection (PIP) family protein YhgE